MRTSARIGFALLLLTSAAGAALSLRSAARELSVSADVAHVRSVGGLQVSVLTGSYVRR